MAYSSYEQAIKTLYNEMYGIAYSSTHNRYDSEDIVQDVFTKLWQVKDQSCFDSPEHLKYWLIRVTENRIKDHWRYVLRHPIVPLDYASEPYVTYEYHESMWELWKLKPREQYLIRLYYYENLSYQDISILLNLSESAVRQRLSRARRSLRKLALKTH
ncbi:MAG: sigma-70 family RNA polymerase sigma factor [Saccharofermentans sp.]|nr:sigma-70 family RNA polymerase sigma factor [Saccharofermentans sp.]